MCLETTKMQVRTSVFAGFCLLLALLDGTSSLKDVTVTIPAAAKIMDIVTLQCKYDLEGEPLYTVKWYKGSNEFYRFIPKELPNTSVFPLPGINVDLSKSTPNEVVLRNVQPEVTGRYKCEVSTDSPNFYTMIESGYMFVVDLPEDDPIMTVDKELLEIGSTVRGNCSSPASYPPANVTWYLNDRRIPESYIKRLSPTEASSTDAPVANRKTPTVTVAGLELEIAGNSFQGSKARLTCIASLFNLYKREKEVVLEEERPRPRPSSVLGTRNASAGFSSSPSAAALLCSVLLLHSNLRLR